ncbi:peptidoglycan/LPS O-acetylase OafA/YrhL [Nocardioides ginsengisegetis]|uniref:Peptidoglycan/LPS O-acetylase OafA/YrhL n=1 Tax=Nocardioides ginsengisegetis TaxID=661491 RepID=A0A7W3J0A9_9ACTN|nr:peptidoglycan/LPS O-acetylase OafA/YrhL [Nocardioides ginsengisegetis]
MSTDLPTAPARRVDVFDGIRGIAILLVVVSHGWALWPVTWISDHAVPSAIFRSGNYGVSIFFVVGAFVSTRALLRGLDSPVGLNPAVAFVRRFLRLSGQLYLLLGVVVLVSVFDLGDPFSDKVTRASVLHIGTYTWNWYLQGHSVAARSDLGHLWYLSVDLQVFVVILLLVHLLRRHRAWLVVALGALLVLCAWWRFHVSGTELLYVSLLRSTVRMDAPVAGALAAAALPYLGSLRPYARPAATVSLVALVPLLHLNVSNASYFSWWGLLLDAALVTFVVSCSLAVPPPAVTRAVGNRVLTWLGRWSLGIYLWHYPVFYFVSRHTHEWRWQARTVLAVLVCAAMVWFGHRVAERRVTTLLRSPVWEELSAGVWPYVRRRSRSMRVNRRLTDSSLMPKRRFTRS